MSAFNLIMLTSFSPTLTLSVSNNFLEQLVEVKLGHIIDDLLNAMPLTGYPNTFSSSD